MPVYHSGRLSGGDRNGPGYYNLPLRPQTRDLTIPFGPRNLIVTSPYLIGMNDVRWDDPRVIPENNGLNILGVNVYRATDAEFGPYVKVNDTPVGVLFYRDKTVEEYVSEEDITDTLRIMEPDGRWLVYTKNRPVIEPGSNGQTTDNIKHIKLEIDDGDGQWLEIPAYTLVGHTGEISLIIRPVFNQVIEQVIPPRLPHPPNGRVRVSYQYLKHSVVSSLNQRIFYKVTTVAQDPNNPSGTIETPLNEVYDRSTFDIDEVDWIWKEAMRRNMWILEQGGERVKVFVRKWMGVKCESYEPKYGQTHNDCPLCFPAGEKVTMGDGTKRDISQVQVDNFVITMDGSVKKVEQIFSRLYEGNLITIGAWGKMPITSTPEHPFLVLRKEDSFCVKYKRSYNKNKCVPLSKKICYKNQNPCSHELKYSWVKAKDLKEGDYVLVPKIGANKRHFTDNEMFLLGLYTADGYAMINKGVITGVSITLNDKTEKDLAGYVRDIFEKEYGTELKILHEKKSNLKLECYRKKISEKFFKLCGTGSHTKILHPSIMNASVEECIAFLRGYIMGDGHRNRRKRGIGYSTVSDNLASQIELLFSKVGIPTSIKRYFHKDDPQRGFGGNMWIWVGRANGNYSKKLGLLYDKELKYDTFKKQHKILDLNSYIAHPIKSIDVSHFSGHVYNIEVSENHTYLINNVVVHNCYGTGIIGGYEGPYSILIAPPETERSIELGDMGLHIRYDWMTWMSNYPLLNPRDFIVRQNNERFIIGPVNYQGQRGVTFQQHFTMSYIDTGDIRYTVPITGGETSVPASTNAYREPLKSEASPVIPVKPEISEPRQVKGRSVTWENITW